MITQPEQRMTSTPGSKLADLPQVSRLAPELRRDIAVVSAVLPFKVNNYVLDELIDWSAAPDDPIFRLTFPHRDMLPDSMYQHVASMLDAGANRSELRAAVEPLRKELNPHPGDQMEKNVPGDDEGQLSGVQHKYRETALVFPANGQTCHSYCGYCFRWAQFVGISELKQQVDRPERVFGYLRRHSEVSDVLLTGGDPMIMKTELLARYVEPLLEPGLEHVRNIRFGTKALSYWPYRFTTDPDADALLRLFDRLVAQGRHVAVMAHFSHPQELKTDAVQEAVRRIRSTGAVIRAQAPIVKHVNDNADAWATMWRELVRIGVVPYYMFVERDTGARDYFALPLHQVLDIYRDAISQVSGLERTARGPVMSASPGKVVLDGTAEVGGEKVFVCRFLQARDPSKVNRPFFAAYDDQALWFDDLKPAFGRPDFLD
ncbi:lysine 2,3-aminomutase [Allokutzneria multivorans]